MIYYKLTILQNPPHLNQLLIRTALASLLLILSGYDILCLYACLILSFAVTKFAGFQFRCISFPIVLWDFLLKIQSFQLRFALKRTVYFQLAACMCLSEFMCVEKEKLESLFLSVKKWFTILFCELNSNQKANNFY